VAIPEGLLACGIVRVLSLTAPISFRSSPSFGCFAVTVLPGMVPD